MSQAAKWIIGVLISLTLLLWVAYENRARVALGAIGTFSLLFSRPLFSAVAGLCSRTTTELSDMAYVHTCADRSHVFAFVFQQ